MREIVIPCECGDKQHQAHLCADTDEQGFEYYWLDFQLSPYQSFWARVKLGVKYMIWPLEAVKWDSVVINEHMIERIKNFIKEQK